MASALDTFAGKVANRVLPETATDAESFGIDWSQIFAIVIAVVQALMDNCPQPVSSRLTSLRNPSRLQRAAVFRESKNACECCGQRYRLRAGAVARALEDETQATDDETLAAIVNETSDPTNLLV